MRSTPKLLWIFAGFACVAALYLCTAHFSQTFQGTDFPDFYCVAKMVAAGLGHRLYDLSLQWQFQARFAGRVGSPFIHPPFEALLYLPFSLVPLQAAYVLWSLFTLFLLALAAWLFERRLAVSAAAPFLFLLFLGFSPVELNLLQGQDSILLLVIFTLALARMAAGREWEGGVWLALGLIKFHFVLPAAFILFLARRSRPFAAGFSLATAALVAVSLAISGWSVVFAYPRFLLELGQTSLSGVQPHAMANLRGLSALVFPQASAVSLFATLALSAVVVALALDGWRRVATNRRTELLALSNTVMAAILLSYHANPHDLTLLLIPLVLTFAYLRAPEVRSSQLWYALRVSGLVLALPPVHVLALRAHAYVLLVVPIIFLFGITYLAIRQPQIETAQAG